MQKRFPPTWAGNAPGSSPSQLQARLDELRTELGLLDPALLSTRTGALLSRDAGGFLLPVWGQEFLLRYPDFTAVEVATGKEANHGLQALILYYFVTCDGTAEAGRWISFTELPDGRFYTRAFQGYTGQELGRAFGDDLALFGQAAESAGGSRFDAGDLAYSFRLFPVISLGVVYWRGDEDFVSTCQVLFDAAAAHHLPTDACAIAGSMLTRRILSSVKPGSVDAR